MTDEEIVKALAEKVMGWVYDPGQPYLAVLDGYSVKGDPIPRWSLPDGTVAHSIPWNPLTSDADACAVLDRMVEFGWHILLDCGWCQESEPQWSCSFEREYPSFGRYHVRENERRPAICLAALKAVGVNTE